MDVTPGGLSAGNTPKAVKDRNCPFCHQAFTSSSLGRHLDLYIRDKKPKPPDGVHDVEAIRRLRQNITRRQPKGSGGRRAASATVGTPTTATSGKSPASGDAEVPSAKSPPSQTGGPQAAGPTPRARNYPFNIPWEVTGVINDLAAPDNGARRDPEQYGAGRGPRQPQRSASRQSLKQHLDLRQQLQDARDTARAAELALREMLGSARAAKQQIDTGSTPFDFDPFSLDFPALTLQCLEPPPTLFASTQHPSPTSWSILPPGHGQFQALRTYFEAEFRRWKIACTAATTAVLEELTYPPPVNIARVDIKAEARKAEKTAERMEKHVYDHLEATYSIWTGLPPEQRDQLWRLELARAVGRKQREVDKLKEAKHLLKQENMHLKTQIEQLTRLQQPREFKIAPPSTLYIDEKLMALIVEEGIVNRKPYVGFNIADRHSDLNTVVSSAIDRWKNVILSTRTTGSGLQTQRPLNDGTNAGPDPGHSTSPHSTRWQPQQSQQRSPGRRNTNLTQHSHSTGAGKTGPSSSASRSAAAPITPSAVANPNMSISDSARGQGEGSDEDEEMSEQDAANDLAADQDADGDADGDTDADADADMDDDPNGYTDIFQQQHPTGSAYPSDARQRVS